MAISNIFGPPVIGENFFGRINELSQAHSILNSGHSIVLSAPRRIGKSSFAKRLVKEKREQGWKCVYIDLERTQSETQFLQTLITEFDKSGIWSKTVKATGEILSGILESIKSIGPVNVEFSKLIPSKDLYSSLANLIDHTQDTLIVIDELTLFLGVLEKTNGNIQDVAFFLNWFRSLRQITPSRIHWIFCGSVGLHNFTGTRNLTYTINDLAELKFDAMSGNEAFGLVRALADSEELNITDDMINSFLATLNWNIPYFIQILFNEIKTNTVKGQPVTEEIIQSSFHTLVHSDLMATWSQRLSEYNGHELAARYLLTLISSVPEGVSKQQLTASFMQTFSFDNIVAADKELSDTLNMLEHDGYIIRTNGRRVFRSPLLRDWWHYKFAE